MAAVSLAAALLSLVLLVYLVVLGVAGAVPAVASGGVGRQAEEPGVGALLAATTAVALGVQPAYRWLRRRIWQLLGLPILPPFDLLRRLPESVTGGIEAENVPQHMVRVLAEGLRTSRTELWLRIGRGYRRAAVWPAEGDPAEGDPPAERGLEELTEPGLGEVVHPVLDGDVHQGLLRLQHFPPRALSRLEKRLLSAYADQAGLVVTTLALRVSLEERRQELARQTEALRLARGRLLGAQLSERRRLERDLHDGAQQSVTALAVQIRLAQSLAGQSPARAARILSASADLAGQIAEVLTRLSVGLYPALLRTAGLDAALRSGLAHNAVPVAIQVDDLDGRASINTTEAAYFVALEAVQNATTHAAATSIRVAVHRLDGRVTVRITDNGRGFDPARVGSGTGLVNLRDRARQAGGQLSVHSTAGRGTVITASLPLEDQVGVTGRR